MGQWTTFHHAKWFLLVGVVQKVITFCVNQTMVLFTSPEVFGRAAVQLELLLSTLLFISREGMRMAAVRQNLRGLTDVLRVVNSSWLPPIVVLAFTTFIAIFHRSFVPTEEMKVIYMYSGAAFIECLGEPFYNVYQSSLYISPKLTAETTALFARSMTTFITVAYFDMGIEGFGLAQLSYAITYLVVLVLHLPGLTITDEHGNNLALSIRSFLPGSVEPHAPQAGEIISSSRSLDFRWPDSSMLRLAATLTASSLLKHLLTEADKIALTLTASSYNQGVYAVTNNYGSLAARILFLPLEDASRLSFSKLAVGFRQQVTAFYTRNANYGRKCCSLDEQGNSTTTTSSASSGKDSRPEANHTSSSQGGTPHSHKRSGNGDGSEGARTRSSRTKGAKKVGPVLRTSVPADELDAGSGPIDEMHTRASESLRGMLDILLNLLRIVFFVGVIFCVFGIPYVPVAVKFVLGQKWDTVETVQSLSAYCLYILVLGVNGISESFVQSVSPSSSFAALNVGLLVSSAAFIAAAVWAVPRYGTAGIIIANVIGMAVRIISNARHILRLFAHPISFFDITRKYRDASSNRDICVVAVVDSMTPASDKKDCAGVRSQTGAGAGAGAGAGVRAQTGAGAGAGAGVRAEIEAGHRVAHLDPTSLPCISKPSIISAIVPPITWCFAVVLAIVVVHLSANHYHSVTTTTITSSGLMAAQEYGQRALLKALVGHLAVGGATGLAFCAFSFAIAPGQSVREAKLWMARKLRRSPSSCNYALSNSSSIPAESSSSPRHKGKVE